MGEKGNHMYDSFLQYMNKIPAPPSDWTREKSGSLPDGLSSHSSGHLCSSSSWKFLKKSEESRPRLLRQIIKAYSLFSCSRAITGVCLTCTYLAAMPWILLSMYICTVSTCVPEARQCCGAQGALTFLATQSPNVYWMALVERLVKTTKKGDTRALKFIAF